MAVSVPAQPVLLSCPLLATGPIPTCPQLADLLERLLADRAALAAVGRKALAKARSWTEHDNAGALVGYVQQALAAAADGAQLTGCVID